MIALSERQIADRILTNRVDTLKNSNLPVDQKREKIGKYLQSYYEMFMPAQATHLMAMYNEQAQYAITENVNVAENTSGAKVVSLPIAVKPTGTF